VGWESQVLGRGLSNRELSDDDDDDGADEIRVVKCGVQEIYLFRLSQGRSVVVVLLWTIRFRSLGSLDVD
jgi:hypothetical protein